MEEMTNDKELFSTEKRLKALSSEELLQIALTEDDDNLVWTAIPELHTRGEQEIYEKARQLCTSRLTRERCVGVGILAQFGKVAIGKPSDKFDQYQEQVTLLLLDMLKQEQAIEVLHAIGIALGHRDDSRVILPLTELSDHPDETVRYGVAFGLIGYENEQAVQALIKLSQDEDDDVRDWATFALGISLEMDTPTIRDALLLRLQDSDELIRAQAMVGLAKRQDKRVVEPLQELLKQASQLDNTVNSLTLEAAHAIADARLYPALLQLRDAWHANHRLYDALIQAIEACRPKPEI